MTAINIGGDTRTDEDKIGLRVRKRLIEAGLLTPSFEKRAYFERPTMSLEASKRTRDYWIKVGFLTPAKPRIVQAAK